MTIIVHHLENSRSQRVLWLLEELGLPYEVRRYRRDKATMLAPPELRQVHPLGKSPVIEHAGNIIAETGRSSNIWSSWPMVAWACRGIARTRCAIAISCTMPRGR